MNRFWPALFLLLTLSCTHVSDDLAEENLSSNERLDTTPTAPAVVEIEASELEIEETDVRDNIIKEHRFGALMAGMPMMELRNIFDPELMVVDSSVWEGDTCAVIKVFDTDGNLDFKIYSHGQGADQYVSNCYLYDTAFVTLENVGVGSSYAEIMSVYEVVSSNTGVDGYMVYTSEMPKTAFVFGYSAAQRDANDLPQLDQLTPESVVTAVYTYIAVEEAP